jgi:hypothetical protein
MAKAHNPGPKPKYGGRIEKRIRISHEVAVLIDKEAATLSVNQGKPLGISDVVERVFRQHYEVPLEREQIMLNTTLEHIIDQLPNRTFSYTYSTGIKVSLQHDSYLWHGEIIDTNDPNRPLLGVCHAQTFQEVSEALVLHGLTDQSKQQFLEAAKNSQQTSTT